MSLLEQMSLCGVRSFGPDAGDKQNIKFKSPVTLFLGQNGVGKTTIIEALKFATTGELPPGAKGQGFVFDPKMARSVLVKGQVKLKFRDIRGQSITVSKSVQAAQRDKRLEFKQLDATISRLHPSGEKYQISGKCADVVNEVCHSLGVSKAILNNVIFCHQDDSNWPMEENKKLKEKFDLIFDASSYNNCLETLRKMVKEKRGEMKTELVKLDSLQYKKKIVEQKRDELQEKETKVEQLQNEIGKCEKKLDPVRKSLDEISNISKVIHNLEKDIAVKQNNYQALREQQKEILEKYEEFLGTDEELEAQIKSFDATVNAKQAELSALESSRDRLSKEEAEMMTRINKEEKQKGRLEEQVQQLQNKLEQRNALILKTYEKLGIKCTSVLDLNTSGEIIEKILEKFRGNLKVEDEKRMALIAGLEEEEHKLQQEVDKCREEHVRMQESIRNKEREVHTVERDILNVIRDVELFESSDNELQFIETQLTRIYIEKNVLEESLDIDDTQRYINAGIKEQNDLEEKLSVLDKELSQLQLYSNLRHELDIERQNVLSKESEIRRLRNKHEQSLRELLKTVPEDNIKTAVEQRKRHEIVRQQALTAEINKKRSEISSLETKLSMLRKKQKELNSDLAKSRKVIIEFCRDEPLATVESNLNKEIDELRRLKGNYNSSIILFENFIEQFRKKDPCCPVCRRGFEDQSLVSDVITQLQSDIQNFPSKLTDTANKLRLKEEYYNKVLRLKPVNDKVIHLEQKQIPDNDKEVAELETKLHTASEELDQLTILIAEPQHNVEIANSIVGDVSLIDQYKIELRNYQRKVQELERSLPKGITGRTVQQVKSEQDDLKLSIQKVRLSTDSLRNRLEEYKEQRMKYKEDVHKLETKKLNIERNMKNKQQLEEKRKELDEKRQQILTAVEDIKKQLPSIQARLYSSQRNKNDAVKINKSKTAALQKEYNDKEAGIQEVVAINCSLKNQSLPKTKQLVDKASETINQLNDKQLRLVAEKASIVADIDNVKLFLNNSNSSLHQLKENKGLRIKKRQEAELLVEIDKLRDRLGSHNVRDLRTKQDQLLKEETDLMQRKNVSDGEKRQLLKRIEDLKSELSEAENKNIAVNYKKKLVEVAVKEQALEDLAIYMKILDKAVQEFHKKRMVQVNKTIRELWRSIYRGNDCDYIEIKIDEGVTGTEKRKTYNYRVIQYKNDIELDMRHRCSAGQKVLASLIIRIALADTFSSNCGILALDEPTTNLDNENITSLGEALSELIKSKHMQRNFQLLVITHDEKFLQQLTQSEQLDSYYLVSRDDDGKSVITLRQAG